VRIFIPVFLCVLLFFGLAAAETVILQPGAEGKDAEIDSQQGSTPHGNTSYLLNYVSG
jgi:hypothetical protein